MNGGAEVTIPIDEGARAKLTAITVSAAEPDPFEPRRRRRPFHRQPHRERGRRSGRGTDSRALLRARSCLREGHASSPRQRWRLSAGFRGRPRSGGQGRVDRGFRPRADAARAGSEPTDVGAGRPARPARPARDRAVRAEAPRDRSVQPRGDHRRGERGASRRGACGAAALRARIRPALQQRTRGVRSRRSRGRTADRPRPFNRSARSAGREPERGPGARSACRCSWAGC